MRVLGNSDEMKKLQSTFQEEIARRDQIVKAAEEKLEEEVVRYHKLEHLFDTSVLTSSEVK